MFHYCLIAHRPHTSLNILLCPRNLHLHIFLSLQKILSRLDSLVYVHTTGTKELPAQGPNWISLTMLCRSVHKSPWIRYEYHLNQIGRDFPKWQSCWHELDGLWALGFFVLIWRIRWQLWESVWQHSTWLVGVVVQHHKARVHLRTSVKGGMAHLNFGIGTDSSSFSYYGFHFLWFCHLSDCTWGSEVHRQIYLQDLANANDWCNCCSQTVLDNL